MAVVEEFADHTKTVGSADDVARVDCPLHVCVCVENTLGTPYTNLCTNVQTGLNNHLQIHVLMT